MQGKGVQFICVTGARGVKEQGRFVLITGVDAVASTRGLTTVVIATIITSFTTNAITTTIIVVCSVTTTSTATNNHFILKIIVPIIVVIIITIATINTTVQRITAFITRHFSRITVVYRRIIEI